MTVGGSEFAPDNVYGHALDLLRETVSASDQSGTRLHLDLACGFARIGEEVQDQLGLTYVGVDFDSTVVGHVQARGLEAHILDLAADQAVTALENIIGSRTLASISLLDAIAELDRPEVVLRVIVELARRTSAAVVVASPNVTHNDVGFKLAFGSFTTINNGLLDRRHKRNYGEEELRSELVDAGLHVSSRNDVESATSDQHFPITHPALQRGTSLNQLLVAIRTAAEPNGRVQQFVWAVLPGPRVRRRAVSAPDHFLTVVIRTVGRRIQELSEVFLCLAAQTEQDFEVVLLGHNLTVDGQLSVERLIEDLPGDLRRKVGLHVIDYGTRATLLNIGFSLSRGRYVSVLDDDDLVFAHWVESFRTLEKVNAGKILRGVGVLQDATRVRVRDSPGIRAEGRLESKFDSEFFYINHLRQNQSPLMTLAFPIGVFADLGIRFDETLSTTEDWDFLLRTAPLTGVADSKQIVAVYHWWVDQESSRTDHDLDEWRSNQLAVDRKIDAQPILLPMGETRLVRQLLEQATRWGATPEEVERAGSSAAERNDLIRAAAELLESRSWRITAPLRFASHIFGRGASIRPSELAHMPSEEIRKVIAAIHSSQSWRRSSFLRRQ